MKKLLTFALCMLLALSVLTALSEEAPTEDIPATEASGEVQQAVELAQKALEQPLDDVPVLEADSDALAQMCLCEPFLYIAPTASDKDAVFVPERTVPVPDGLPANAEIRADSGVTVLSQAAEGERAVMPLLYCAGYCGSTSYLSVGTLYDHAFSVLLIDREDGAVVARLDGSRRESGPMMIEQGNYREDMNGNRVYHFRNSPRTQLSEFWADVLDGVGIGGNACLVGNGELRSLLVRARGDIVVPEGIRSIGNGLFKDCVEIASVQFPESLASIGSRAFEGCTGLERASFSGGLESLPADCFNGCASLREIELPEGLKEIGVGCFENCVGLKSIRIPKSVREIPDACFSGCAALESVQMPEKLRTIGDSAFKGCSSIREIELPEETDTLMEYAFAGCSALERINADNLWRVHAHAFEDCVSLKAYINPMRMGNVTAYCFSGCTALETVELSNIIYKIDDFAFQGCKSLRAFTVSEKTNYVGERAFSGCKSLASIQCEVTEGYAARHWNKDWATGCDAGITWKPASKAPLILGIIAAIAAAAFVVYWIAKKKKTSSSKS